MNWIVLAVLAGIFSNGFNFLSRYILIDDTDPTAYAWYFELIRLLSFGAIAFFDWKIIITPYSILLFLLLGVTELLASF